MLPKSHILRLFSNVRPTLIDRNRLTAVTLPSTRLFATAKRLKKEETNASTRSTKLQTDVDSRSLTVQWENGKARYHNIWLRHHCPCEQCMCPDTKQKLLDMSLIPEDVKPKELEASADKICITWDNGHESIYDAEWLKHSTYDEEYKQVDRSEFKTVHEEHMKLWNKDIITKEPPKEFSFNELQRRDPDVEFSLIDTIVHHGFTFVNDTPLDPESLEKVCEFVGNFVQESLYGRVYRLLNTELIHSDISYLDKALPAHTDHTYFSFPAGIQAMHCTHHHGTGGMSLLVDGFHAAKLLHQEDPDAFRVLTRTEVPFEYNSKFHISRVHGPMIQLNPFTGEIALLRYHNGRIGPFVHMGLSYDEMEEFYRAVRVFNDILRRPENELWFKLTPGRVIVMDNRRVMHGRSALAGSRELQGCYVALDDYIGRWRAMKATRE